MRGAALIARAMVTWRMRSLAESATSESASSVLRTGHSMFDCPEHSHTSPIRTSFAVCDFDALRAVSVCGPPADIAGSVSDHAPFASAFALAEAPANVTLTSSPAAARPNTVDGPVALEHGVVDEESTHQWRLGLRRARGSQHNQSPCQPHGHSL